MSFPKFSSGRIEIADAISRTNPGSQRFDITASSEWRRVELILLLKAYRAIAQVNFRKSIRHHLSLSSARHTNANFMCSHYGMRCKSSSFTTPVSAGMFPSQVDREFGSGCADTLPKSIWTGSGLPSIQAAAVYGHVVGDAIARAADSRFADDIQDSHFLLPEQARKLRGYR